MKLHNKYISIFHEKNTIKIISFTCLTVLFDRDLVNLVINIEIHKDVDEK